MEIQICRTRSNYPDYKFLVTGHSLGGALASLASLSMVYYGLVPSTQLFLYTFGMPLAGDEQYAALDERYVVNNMRVVNRDDCSLSLNYDQLTTGLQFRFTMALKLFWTVTWIKNDKRNDKTIDWLKTKAHTIYFGIDVGSYCKSQVMCN